MKPAIGTFLCFGINAEPRIKFLSAEQMQSLAETLKTAEMGHGDIEHARTIVYAEFFYAGVQYALPAWIADAMRSLMDHYSGPYAQRIRAMATNLCKGLPPHFDEAHYEIDPDDPLSSYGPFRTAFETGELEVPGYLVLLNLSEPGVDLVIDRIQEALENTKEPGRWVDALFADPNWRPHLVGSVAVLLDRGARLNTASVWRAIDSGSWVIPQLVVTAYFSDPAFSEHLVGRIKRRCDVGVPSDLATVKQHVVTGSGGTPHVSPKLLVSLLSMGARLPQLAPLLKRVAAEPDYAGLIEMDMDGAENITNSWCKSIVAHFASRRIDLFPRVI